MKNIYKIGKELFITSDEKAKEGDWGYIPFQGGNVKLVGKYFADDWKKIILTDNKDLIKDGVQAIDDEFLEWFVKNPSCEKVRVEESTLLNTSRTYLGVEHYKIIIPNDEPNQIKCYCGHTTTCDCSPIDEPKDVVLGYKTSLDAQMLDRIEPKQEEIDFYAKELMLEKERAYKQETLEEVELAILFHNTYEKLAPSFGYETREDTKYFDITTPNGKLMIAVCKEIIKWQQERMYSEEEVHKIIESYQDIMENNPTHTKYNDWFKQFKKK